MRFTHGWWSNECVKHRTRTVSNACAISIVSVCVLYVFDNFCFSNVKHGNAMEGQ